MLPVFTQSRSSKLAACALTLALACALPAQNGHHITTPQEALGFDIGDDYHLANYTQLTAWWQKLAGQVTAAIIPTGFGVWVHTFTFPPQDFKLRKGSRPRQSTTRAPAGD